jgi:hypothetical protein
MKKIASININFQLTKSIESQLEQLDTLLPELEKRGITIELARITSSQSSPSVKDTEDMGPQERAWLACSGRSRMNMRDKTLTREEQASKYLLERQEITPDLSPESNLETSEPFSGDPFKL